MKRHELDQRISDIELFRQAIKQRRGDDIVVRIGGPLAHLDNRFPELVQACRTLPCMIFTPAYLCHESTDIV
jgi:hypothetical protein